MARICKRIGFAILSFAFALWVVMAGYFPAVFPVIAKADTLLTYEQTNVMDDLKTSTIDGESFDLMHYGFNAFKETQVLSFVEYCYSFYPEKQGNYGLYVYVYNPKGLKFDTTSSLNTIQFAYGESTSTNYAKYPLKFLNCSTETNYEGLFYKFKVGLTDSQRESILATVNSTERYYRVSGIELLTNGNTNATDFSVGTIYRYSGYAAGYGSNPSAENTLVCKREEAEILTLNVHATQYRPKGTNGKNEYTQDSLHSVYFAVPNDVIEKYGEMTAVHATWLNAVTAPIFVTGNQSIYNQVSDLLGDYVYGGKVQDGGKNNDMDYALIATKAHREYRDTIEAAMAGYIAYNVLMDYSSSDAYNNLLHYLYFSFYAKNGDADNYTVSSEQLSDELEKSKSKYGGELVNGKYAACMFDSVDNDFTEVNIQADEKFSLTSEVLSKNWWEKLWGLDGTVSDTTTFDGIQAIYKVKETDITGTAEEVSEKLFISESDYDDFCYFYNVNKALCSVYLFRYMQSEYISHEVTEYEHTTDRALIGGKFNTYEVVDTNAYFAQMSVQLDFDIIDVTFSNGETNTVIPVVSDPIDVVPDATPPVYTRSDKKPDWLKWLKIVLVVILIFVLVIVGWPILQPLFLLIGQGIVWLIKLPFKTLGKAIRKRKRKKEARKNHGKDG